MSEKDKKQNRPLNQEEVEEMLEKGESFAGLEIGDIDFTEHVFENYVNFMAVNFVGSVNFYFAKFLNGAAFTGAKFSGKKGAIFMGVEFSGEESAYFMNVVFSGMGRANFCVAKFSGEGGAYFHSASFSGEGGADFSRAEFSGKQGAIFFGAEFSGKEGVDFSSAKFSGEGSADFSYVDFSGAAKVIFSSVEFLCEDKISFGNTIFKKDCIINFDMVKIKNPKNLFFRDVYLGNTSFFQTDVEDFNFNNVEFMKFPEDKINWFKRLISIRREGLIDEFWNQFVTEDYQRDIDRDYYSHVEIIYRQLKRNFEEKRDYARAGDFHYGEMEMKRLQKSKFKQYISLTAFYKYFSGYGQKWFRAFFWFAGFVVLFMFLNLNWLEPINKTRFEIISNGKRTVDEIYVPPTKFDSFLYTFKTMTLREDKRFEITDPIGSLVVILQTVIGPTILALMFLAIRRQFRR